MNDSASEPIALGSPTFRIEGDRSALFAALALAQAGFGPVTKNRTVTVQPREGRAYTFDYATLDVVLDACRPALNANGFALIQPFTADGDACEVRTMLCHSAGLIELAYRFDKPDAIQKLGSVLTYVRRYSVACLLGVSSEEDDDGNAADGNQAKASPRGERMQPDKPKPQTKPAQQAPPKQQDLKPHVDTVEEAMAKAAARKVQTEREDDAMPGGPQGALPVEDDINGPDGEAVPEDEIDPKRPMLPQTKLSLRATMTKLFSVDGKGEDVTASMRGDIFRVANRVALERGVLPTEMQSRRMIDFMYALAAEHEIDPDGQVSRADVGTMLKALSKRAGVQ